MQISVPECGVLESAHITMWGWLKTGGMLGSGHGSPYLGRGQYLVTEQLDRFSYLCP